jgi:ribonuclease-3
LYLAYQHHSEGDLTKMKSLLVCGSRLAEVATTLGLGDYVQMSRAEAATGGRHRASILADTTEAVIGAVFLDGGLTAAANVIRLWLLDSCDEVLSHRGLENYKSRLQEMVQARYKSPPRYRVLAAEGPDHERVFRVCVTFNGKDLGRGEGANKKAAEQLAARDALGRIASDPALLGDQP